MGDSHAMRSLGAFRRVSLKVWALTAVSGATAALAAAVPAIPAEFIGTWASAPVDCTRNGDSTLHITETSVEQSNLSGQLNAGYSPESRSIEVVFRTPAGRAKAQNVRTYMLSIDGARLLELRAGQVVSTRTKCTLAAAA